MRALPTTFALLLVALAPSAALAEQTVAERLFREGRQLLQANQLEGACAKFRESQKLEPAAGTALNLGDCLERRGMTKSAVDAYREALAGATARGRKDWEQLASMKIAALSKDIPVLVVKVAAPPSGLEVRRDDILVEASAFDTRMAIDPGEHSVKATAPGKKPWLARFTVPSGSTQVIEVPELPSDAPASGSDDPSPEPREGDPGATQRTIGIVVGVAGAVGLALGGVSGLLASGELDDAKARCPSYPDRCASDGSGTEANERAKTWATLSTVGFIAGGALLAAGAVLFFTAPRRAAVAVGPSGVVFRGTF